MSLSTWDHAIGAMGPVGPVYMAKRLYEETPTVPEVAEFTVGGIFGGLVVLYALSRI